ncbi:hypothetical protein GW796_10935 [archaeon]|nr:hypothetical protein [archaeon]
MKTSKLNSNLFKQQDAKHLKLMQEIELNPKLSLAKDLDDYYIKYGDYPLVAVIPALSTDNEKANTYFSCPTKMIGEIMPQHERLSPVFMMDSSKEFNKFGKDMFELSREQIPNLYSENWKLDKYKYSFLFDSEERCLWHYVSKVNEPSKYIKSPFFDDMVEHILKNPIVCFFHGCDDGHVGLRFPTQEKMFEFLDKLECFDNIFNIENKNISYMNNDDMKDLIKIKKENPGTLVSEFFNNRLEYHN